MPPDMSNTSGAYQGPMHFSYKGKTLRAPRKEREGDTPSCACFLPCCG